MAEPTWLYSPDLQAYYRRDTTRNLLITQDGKHYRLGPDGRAVSIAVPPTSQPGREPNSQPRTPFPSSTSARDPGQNLLRPAYSSAPARPAGATIGSSQDPNAGDRPRNREPLSTERQLPASSRGPTRTAAIASGNPGTPRPPDLSSRGPARGSDSNARTLPSARTATSGAEPYAATGLTSRDPSGGQLYLSNSKALYPASLTPKEQRGYREHLPAAAGRDGPSRLVEQRQPGGSNNPSDPDVVPQSTDSIDSDERDLRARFSRYRASLLDKGAPQETAERLARRQVSKDLAELPRRQQIPIESTEPSRRQQLPNQISELPPRPLPNAAPTGTIPEIESQFGQFSIIPAVTPPQRTTGPAPIRQLNPVNPNPSSSRQPDDPQRQPSRQPESPARPSSKVASRDQARLQRILEELMKKGYTREDAFQIARSRILDAARNSQS